jgi:hypothetical protein
VEYVVMAPQYAFPNEGKVTYEAENGMTLRDYFAGQALAGLLANNSPHSPRFYTRIAYEHADEMLKARAGG